MTAAEVYELTTHGGASDFRLLIEVCEALGPYCLIGGMAVNCYVEPVYTLDADLVIAGSSIPSLTSDLGGRGFRIEAHAHSVNVFAPAGQLRIRFTTDARYQPFLAHSISSEVLGVTVKIACLEDVTQGKLWAYSDPARRLSKRKKDELDLIRLAEAFPELKARYPAELRSILERG